MKERNHTYGASLFFRAAWQQATDFFWQVLSSAVTRAGRKRFDKENPEPGFNIIDAHTREANADDSIQLMCMIKGYDPNWKPLEFTPEWEKRMIKIASIISIANEMRVRQIYDPFDEIIIFLYA